MRCPSNLCFNVLGEKNRLRSRRRGAEMVRTSGAFKVAALSVLRRLRSDRSGATAIEYGLIVAGVAIAILASVFALGDELNDMFGEVQSALEDCAELGPASDQGQGDATGRRCK
jgi:pilus assembly protein Flp/PilA